MKSEVFQRKVDMWGAMLSRVVDPTVAQRNVNINSNQKYPIFLTRVSKCIDSFIVNSNKLLF
jgi:hypothetical protein